MSNDHDQRLTPAEYLIANAEALGLPDDLTDADLDAIDRGSVEDDGAE